MVNAAQLETAAGTAGRVAAVNVRWRVEGLSFWQRWLWLFMLVLAILAVAFIVYGFIRPHRFPRELALTFVPEYDELDRMPQPLAQWRGTGIGWYRDAQAFLQPDYRLSGKSRGSLAGLRAVANGAVLLSTGPPLYRELDINEWEEVRQVRPVRAGTIYRISETGPFFGLARAGCDANRNKR